MSSNATGVTIGAMPRKAPTPPESGRPARAGDWVVVHAHAVGEHERTGLIVEVLGTPDHVRYRVRWDEEHESIHYPGSDTTIRRKATP